MSPKQTDAEFLAAARKRFYELAGVPDPGQAAKPVDRYMEEWKTRGAGDQTQQFIAMNEERVRQGLSPLGCNGLPIEAPKIVIPPPPPLVPEDDFFSSSGGPKVAKRYG